MKKKNIISENFLERIPKRNDEINWSTNENDIVTLEIKNTGIFNKIAQVIFKKPRISYVHLDENGSFVWQIIDGKTNIIDIGIAVYEHFGEKASPLYERLAKFFQILESYYFISWVK